jgi:cobaltochelatase CobS
MNRRLSLDPFVDPVGRYVRFRDGGFEWWHVKASGRDSMFRIQHGHNEGSADLETEIDLDNLGAKMRRWQREGFVREDAATEQPPRRAVVPGSLASLAAASRNPVDGFDGPADGELGGGDQTSQEFGGTIGGGSGSNHPTDAGDDDAADEPSVIIGGVAMRLGEGGPLTPRVNPAFLFADKFSGVMADITENRRVMLIGHTGCGKTSLIEQIAARSMHGTIRSNMNGQTTIGDFVGFWSVKGGETVWIDGVLPIALREGLWLIIDEIDFAEPAILAVLTAVLEPGGSLMLKEKGNEIIAPHPEFRLFATANAVGAMAQYRHLYQGSNLMNEAFLDRWRVYMVDYLSAEEEARVLMRTLGPRLPEEMANTLAAIAADCRAAFAREDLASAFSTRRLLDWAQLIMRTGDVEAAAHPTIYAKVSPGDAALIHGIIGQYIAPAV